MSSSSTQMEFAAVPPGPVVLSKRDKFEAFHRRNPMVYRRLVQMSLRLKRKGNSHVSMRDLWGIIRFSSMVRPGDEAHDMNNDHTAFYSRLIEEREPELVGFFHKKKSVADSK